MLEETQQSREIQNHSMKDRRMEEYKEWNKSQNVDRSYYPLCCFNTLFRPPQLHLTLRQPSDTET